VITLPDRCYLGDHTVIRRSTRGPKSKQNKLEMLSVTTSAGQLSIQPVHPRESTNARAGTTDISVPRQGKWAKTSAPTEEPTCFVDLPAGPNAEVTKRTTRSTTAARVTAVQSSGKSIRGSRMIAKAGKGKRGNGRR
jgi:hypothetical protein